MPSIGQFAEPRTKARHTGLNTGDISFDPNTGDNSERNNTIPVANDIGKAHDPKQYYFRESEVKSAGGYLILEDGEAE